MDGKHTIIPLEQQLMINQISPISYIQQAHTNSIESLAVHPNNSILATGSHNKTIKVWDASSLKETMTLADHKQGVWSLDYSKDGNLLASGSADKSVLIWDSKKSSPGIRINTHKDKVYCVRFNETGKLLGTCGEQGELFIWDIAKIKEPLVKIDVPTLILYDIRWSGNQQVFFVTTLGSQLLAQDAKTFKQISSHYVTPNIPDSKCESVAASFKQINNRVFCGTSRGVIAWYEWRDNKLVKETELSSHLDSVRTINYHPNKKILLSTGRDGSAKLWDVSSNTHQPKILGNLVLHTENIPGAGFIGNDLVATGSWDQKLALWNIKDLIK